MEANQVITVAMHDGYEEHFALGVGDMPEQVDPEKDETRGATIRFVLYTVGQSGALLVGWGLRDRDLFAPRPMMSLGESNVTRLHIVKAFAAGTWTAVSGGDYWACE